MTQKYDDVENKGKNDEPEIFATAVPAAHNEPPIPAGHARFYCSKCHTPYDLPDKATSWRCANCMTFNSITRGNVNGARSFEMRTDARVLFVNAIERCGF